MVYSDDVTIHDVSIQNPPDAPDDDGIDTDSSRLVRVSDTHIDADDDAACLKSDRNEQGREVGRPTENVVVVNYTVEHGRGDVIIGSETVGNVRHVAVTNRIFTGTGHGIHIKPKCGHGGTVGDLRLDTIIMHRVACPFVINGCCQTDTDSDPKPITEATPDVRNVGFHHIIIEEVESVVFLTGLPEQRFEGISLTNVDIDTTCPFDASDLSSMVAKGYDQRHGVPCKSLSRVSFRDVRAAVPDGNGTPLTTGASSTIVLDGFEAEANEGPTVEADGIENLRIGGRTAPDDDEPSVRVRGESDSESSVLLAGSYDDIDETVVSVQPETVER